ncbi:SlyX family protein [Kineobactrum salinum]|uniref:SlyX family protein n=1 Tax=Kineobactrum salinum TaxID=2708301 RepID=A0A6C0UB69_9GAMM|nr:SlyX family protein [Kineobactrum salinum]QIB67244.1 SlyX family protein [Kineobactrum salinum]
MDKKLLQSQLEELQTQLAFQDDTVQALQQALASQQQELMLLQRQLELLKQRQDEQASALEELPGSGDSEQPPHY